MPAFSNCLSQLDLGFLAGFFEGEATFTIGEQNAGQSYSCGVRLKIRDDDQDLLEWMVAVTGVGRLTRVAARGTSRPQIAWSVASQADCVELERILARCGFHGRRATQLAIWSEAVRVWVDGRGVDRRGQLRELKQRLESARAFRAPYAPAVPLSENRPLTLGYISGLVAAEGSFGISRCRPRFSMHLRGDDRPLLELLGSVTVPGRVYDYTPPGPLNPSSVWVVAARPQLEHLLDLLREADLPGRKRAEMDVWAVAVDELSSAKRLRVRPRRELLELAADRLRVSRLYHPSTRPLFQLGRRDIQAESLEALRAWADATPGRLPCLAYSRWRRSHPGTPTRNTVASAFGSWHAAMDAAGLADRAARSRPTRAGGGDARRERLDRQRARVAAAVRQFEAEHGRMPRAMEFFKWSLTAVPDTPTQGTVYRLFPGGWPAVLDACQTA